jgi:lipoate-protein ligase A
MKSAELLFLASGPGEPAWNMALDEALLLSASEIGAPVLRSYGWTLPAATFGYFQRLAEVEKQTLLRPLVRRPTGGGIVPHDRDWTYSLVAPPGHPWHALRAKDSYRAIHEWIAEALARLGCVVELAPCCLRSAPGQCFVGYEQFDLLWHGRKIAGAAQRRNRSGLLIQGSIQPPPRLERDAWEAAMRDTAPPSFFSSVRAFEPGESLLGLAQSLSAEKYSLASYNGQR